MVKQINTYISDEHNDKLALIKARYGLMNKASVIEKLIDDFDAGTRILVSQNNEIVVPKKVAQDIFAPGDKFIVSDAGDNLVLVKTDGQ